MTLYLKFSCKEWLTNCGRTDLFGKPVHFLNKNCCVCSDHFNVKMYSNPERTRLLPSAIPTEFGNLNLEKLCLFCSII